MLIHFPAIFFNDYSSFHEIKNENDRNLESNKLFAKSNNYDGSLAIIDSENREIEYIDNYIVLLSDDSYEWSPRMFISDDENSDEENDNRNIRGKLASWALNFNISHAALNSLLPILQESGLSYQKIQEHFFVRQKILI